ncbi:hypothetical protein I4U23_019168 [Adineta vaga]|nr:hypothetical protein I4U23_019168 [Adineta vaga]
MSAPKRLRQRKVPSENDLAVTTSTFIESLLTPKTSTSRTTDNPSNHKLFSKENSSADSQNRSIQSKQKNKFEDVTITQNNIDKTQNIIEDSWVCPVAVALRRAGYDVPLRPSKSWLKRDRKKQASLRQR